MLNYYYYYFIKENQWDHGFWHFKIKNRKQNPCTLEVDAMSWLKFLFVYPSQQSGHSPHLNYNKSIHNSYKLVIYTISIHSYNTWALLEAIGGNNHRGAWYFHSGPDDDLPTIGELPHFNKNFDWALSAASESPWIESYCPRNQDTNSNEIFNNTAPLGVFCFWKTNLQCLVQMCQTDKQATIIHISSKNS